MTDDASPAIVEPRRLTARQSRAVSFFLDNLVWFILAIILILFSATIEHFFQIGIFFNILQHATFVGILAVGLSLCIISGHMDLSIESTMAFTAMLGAWLAADHAQASGLQLDGWVVFLFAIAVGAAVGLTNGFFIIRLRINAFIMTLSMFIALRGLGLLLTGGRTMTGVPPDLRFIAVERIGDSVPLFVLVLIAVYLIFHFVLAHTRFGRYIYLIGGNPTAPFRAGIPVKRILYMTFVISGVLAAIAGWLMIARFNGASANLGLGMLFEAFAAVVIGGVSLQGGVGRLSGVFAGAILLSAIDTAINVMGLEPHYMQVIRGGLMLLAVVLDSAKTHIRRRYL